MTLDVSRHTPIIKPWEHNEKITIIGGGATGSRVFMALVEFGFSNIDVIDFDHVELHNLANQAFIAEDIGKLKVDALRDRYIAKTGAQPPESMRFINGCMPLDGHKLQGTVFLLTDTMSSRREIYDSCLKDNFLVTRVIETRMASLYGNVYMFTPANDIQADKWVNTLISDDQGEVSACGSSISVGSTASLIANYAVMNLIAALTNPEGAVEKIDLFFRPFITETQETLK
jgi:molybdopterin/thiamine biosynthesis adenylyltransferase